MIPYLDMMNRQGGFTGSLGGSMGNVPSVGLNQMPYGQNVPAAMIVASLLSQLQNRKKVIDRAVEGQPRTYDAQITKTDEYQGTPSFRKLPDGRYQLYVEGDVDSKWVDLNTDEIRSMQSSGRLSPSMLEKLKKRSGL